MARSELMTPNQLAAYLNLDAGTLQNWRTQRRGPRWVKLGKGRNAKVVYNSADVERWIAEMTVSTVGTTSRRK